MTCTNMRRLHHFYSIYEIACVCAAFVMHNTTLNTSPCFSYTTATVFVFYHSTQTHHIPPTLHALLPSTARLLLSSIPPPRPPTFHPLNLLTDARAFLPPFPHLAPLPSIARITATPCINTLACPSPLLTALPAYSPDHNPLPPTLPFCTSSLYCLN